MRLPVSRHYIDGYLFSLWFVCWVVIRTLLLLRSGLLQVCNLPNQPCPSFWKLGSKLPSSGYSATAHFKCRCWEVVNGGARLTAIGSRILLEIASRALTLWVISFLNSFSTAQRVYLGELRVKTLIKVANCLHTQVHVEIFFVELKDVLTSNFICHCWEVVSKYFCNVSLVANYAVINRYGNVCGIFSFLI